LRYNQFAFLAQKRARELSRDQLEEYYSKAITSRAKLKKQINGYQVAVAVLTAALFISLIN